MNMIEAQDLDMLIRDERRKKTSINLRQIGNGEWVVTINNHVYIWDAEDYERWKAEGEAQRQRVLAHIGSIG